MIKVDGLDVELLLIHPIYKNNSSGDPALLKEIRVRRWFKIDTINSVQEYVTTRHTIAKNRCLVYDKFANQWYGVFHSVEDVRAALSLNKKQIGFK